MAWAAKCDRCGKCFDWQQGEVDAFAYMKYDRAKDKYSTEDEEYDLCPECVESLDNWFKGGN